jgi:hypothetical protein
MAKTKKPKKPKPIAVPQKLNLPDDDPVKLNMTFDEAIKKAVNTPIKTDKKIAKK